MIQNKLSALNKEFNEGVKLQLEKIYLEVVGVNKEVLREGIINVNKKRKEEDPKGYDKRDDEEFNINDKVEDAFEMTIGQWSKDSGKNIEFEETFDEKGNSILKFTVTQAIEKYTIPYSLDTELKIGEIKKEVLEK